MMRMLRAAGTALLVLALSGPACIGRGSSASTNAYLVSSLVCPDGVACVSTRTGDGGAWSSPKKGASIEPGSVVRVASQGRLVLARGKDSVVEIKPHNGNSAEMKITSPTRLEVISGDVLVDNRTISEMAVESDGVVARARKAVFRFDRRFSLRVGVYDGAAQMQAGESTLPVARLRQGVAQLGVLERRAAPLRIDAKDAWDQRLLRDVIDLDRELTAQGAGFETLIKRARLSSIEQVMPSARAFRTFRAEFKLPSDLGFVEAFLDRSGFRPRSGDVLIGLVLASIAQERGKGALPHLFTTFMRLFDAGASWGLLAREYGISGEAVLNSVVHAVGLRTGDATTGGTGGGGTGGGSTGGSSGGGSSGGSSGGGSTGGSSGGGSSGGSSGGGTDGGGTDGGGTDGGGTDGGGTDGGGTDGGGTDGGGTDGGGTDGGSGSPTPTPSPTCILVICGLVP